MFLWQLLGSSRSSFITCTIVCPFVSCLTKTFLLSSWLSQYQPEPPGTLREKRLGWILFHWQVHRFNDSDLLRFTSMKICPSAILLCLSQARLGSWIFASMTSVAYELLGPGGPNHFLRVSRPVSCSERLPDQNLGFEQNLGSLGVWPTFLGKNGSMGWKRRWIGTTGFNFNSHFWSWNFWTQRWGCTQNLSKKGTTSDYERCCESLKNGRPKPFAKSQWGYGICQHFFNHWPLISELEFAKTSCCSTSSPTAGMFLISSKGQPSTLVGASVQKSHSNWVGLIWLPFSQIFLQWN